MEKNNLVRRKSFGPRIALFTAVPISVVLTVVAGLLVLSVQQNVATLKLREINSKAEHAMSVVENYFDPLAAACDFLAELDEVHTVFEEGIRRGEEMRYEDDAVSQELLRIMKALHASLGDQVQAFWICGLGNKEMMTSTDWYSDPGLEPTERPWYSELVESENDVVISSAYIDVESNATVVSVMKAVKDASGNNIGVVAIDVFLDGMLQAMDSVRVGDTGTIVVADMLGNIVYSPARKDLMYSIFAHDYPDTMVTALNANHSTYAEEEQEDATGTYYASVIYSPVLNWRLVAIMPTTEFNAEAAAMVVPLLIAIAVCIAVCIIEGALLGNVISSPIKRLRDALGLMADGSFNFSLDGHYACEFGDLKASMLAVRDTLAQTVTEISNSTEHVDAGTAQISDAAQALAQGTTEQASSVEELSSSIAALSEHTADGVAMAEDLRNNFADVNDSLRLGDERMKQLSVAMEDIKDKSEKIEKIIKTISDIAFQTNILALNAAVEAARAGQAGKGFSVVADEVRALATKCDVAANDTNVLIQGTCSAVASCATLTEETAKALDTAAAATEKAYTSIGELAERYAGEATSLKEVSSGIDQISMVIQNNSATAEQTAAACNEMVVQVQALYKLTQNFKLD